MAYHKGCPCCPTRPVGIANYTWQVLELDGTERWRRVTVPTSAEFNEEGSPTSYYKHGGWTAAAARNLTIRAGGVIVTDHAVMIEYGSEIGDPAGFVVTSRLLTDGTLVAMLDLGSSDGLLGRMGPDRIAILRQESILSVSHHRVEVYDVELNYLWETSNYPVTQLGPSNVEAGYTTPVLVLAITDGSGPAPTRLVAYDADGNITANNYMTNEGFGMSLFRGVSSVPGTPIAVDGTAVAMNGGISSFQVRSVADGSFLGTYVNFYSFYPANADQIITTPYVLWSSTQKSGVVTPLFSTPGAINSLPIAAQMPAVGTGWHVTGPGSVMDWMQKVPYGGRVVWASPDVYFMIHNESITRWTQGAMDYQVPVSSPTYQTGGATRAFAVTEDILIVENNRNDPRRIIVVDTGIVTFDGAIDDFLALGPSSTWHICDASENEILSLHGTRSNWEFQGRTHLLGGPQPPPPDPPDPTGACCCTDGMQCIDEVTSSECDDYKVAVCLTSDANFLPGEDCDDTCLPP